MDFRIEFRGVPVSIESDAETGEVTAYNSDLRVMAVGPNEEIARERFFRALTTQVRRDLIRGRPLNPRLRERVERPERV